MKRRILLAASVAVALAMTVFGGQAAEAASTGSAHLNLSTLVLSGGDQYHYPTITTSCSLMGPLTVPVLSSSNSTVDFIEWPQSTVKSGDKANWEVFSSDYTPGDTYHLNDPDELCTNFSNATVTGKFNVRLATASDFLSAKRKNGFVTASGTTRQFERSADYGLGGWVRHAESVTIQYQKGKNWYAVRKVTSNSKGTFTTLYRGTVTRNYRLLIPTTSTLQQSISSVRRT